MRDSQCLRSRRTKSQTANTGGRGSPPLHGIFVEYPPRKQFSLAKHPQVRSAVSARKDRLYIHPVEEKKLLLRFWLSSAALLLGWNRIGWNRFVFTTLRCPPNAIVADDPGGRSATG